MIQPTHAELLLAIGEVRGEVRHLHDDMGQIKADVRDLRAAMNMGKGALWLTLKLGIVLAAVGGTVAWAWERFW